MAALSAVFAAAAVFTQCQLKYGAERDNFLHRWYERPLHQNTAYADADDGGFLNPAAWKKTVESFRQAKIDGVKAKALVLAADELYGIISRYFDVLRVK